VTKVDREGAGVRVTQDGIKGGGEEWTRRKRRRPEEVLGTTNFQSD
jgi:hypothetical protein